MSLINKMLQDLEERRSEGDVVLGLQGTLRAVPEQRRIHPVWWIVLVLVLALVGAVSWFWGRQTAPLPVGPQPALALKLAPDLGAVQPPKPITTEAAAPAAPIVVAQAKDNEVKPVPPATPPAAVVAPAQTKAASEAPVAPVTAPVPAAAPAAPAPVIVAKVETPVQSTPPAVPPVPVAAHVSARPSASQRVSEFDVPANVSKQMKDVTPQQRAENEYRRGVSLMQQGSTSEAMRALESALQIDPQHMVARQTLVGLLLESKRQDEAIRRLQDGLALDKSQPALAMMLARLQVEKGELKPAIDTLDRSLQYASERADYQAFLAALYQRDGRHREAVDHYLVALRRAPQNGLWWMGMGISLQADNRLQEARDAFGRAKAANSLSPELLAFVEQKLSQLR